jgi:hypothetical protein
MVFKLFEIDKHNKYAMNKQFIQLKFDVFCSNCELHPIYRVFVDDELITERKWRWEVPQIYLEEFIQLEVSPGRYQVRFESIPPGLITNTNGHVTQGPARLKNNSLLKVGE